MPLDHLTALIAKDPLKAFRFLSVSPPAGDQALRGLHDVTIDESSLRFFSQHEHLTSSPSTVKVDVQHRFKSAAVSMPVAWIKFQQGGTSPSELRFDLEYEEEAHPTEDQEHLPKEFLQRITAADRLPVFFLPWLPDHFVRLTIPEYRSESVVNFGAANTTNQRDEVWVDPFCPHLFFTATLTGCSVFAYGDPRHPTVVHVGTKAKTPYQDADAALFWRELLLLERFQRLHHAGHAYEVNVDQYMGNTQQLLAFEHWLSQQPTTFTVEAVTNWGAIFGIRYGRLWTFYLQENAYVIAYRVEKKTIVKKRTPKNVFDKVFGDLNEAVKVDRRKQLPVKVLPLSVRPFYPEAGGSAEFQTNFKLALI